MRQVPVSLLDNDRLARIVLFVDALPELVPVSDEYAALPVAEAFDWTAMAEALGIGEWYLVAFRSVRRADADEVRLTLHDDAAHAEAMTAPGFRHYFKGPTASDGSCLSFCLWDGRPQAREAAGRPAHAEASTLGAEMYERYTLEFLRVHRADAGAPLEFEPYDGPPHAEPPLEPEPVADAPLVLFPPAPQAILPS